MNEENKNANKSNWDTEKKTKSVKDIQIAPVISTNETFTYNGDKKEENGN